MLTSQSSNADASTWLIAVVHDHVFHTLTIASPSASHSRLRVVSQRHNSSNELGTVGLTPIFSTLKALMSNGEGTENRNKAVFRLSVLFMAFL